MNADDFLRLASEVQERGYKRATPYKTIPIEELRRRIYCSHAGCEEWRSSATGIIAHEKTHRSGA